MSFSRKNTMNMAWKSHGKKHENPLNIQRFRTHEKKKLYQTKNTRKCHEIKWSLSCFFHGFLIIWKMRKYWFLTNWKAIFHGVGIYGVFMGVFKFMPHKKPWVFSEWLNINGSWTMKWLLTTFFHYLWIMPLAYFSWERQRHGHRENLVFNYSRLLNQIHHWGSVGWLIWSYIHVVTTLTLNKS